LRNIWPQIEVYVDNILVKSMSKESHLTDLEEAFETMNRANMKMNRKKSFFGLVGGKFLGFMVSVRGIKVHPSSSKAILSMTPPKKSEGTLVTHREVSNS
jgi:hypothetical protein